MASLLICMLIVLYFQYWYITIPVTIAIIMLIDHILNLMNPGRKEYFEYLRGERDTL